MVNIEKYEMILGYSQYLSPGLIKELAKELGINETDKRKVIEKAFEVMDPNEVLLEIFFDIRAIYGRIIRDILEIANEEIREIILKNKDIEIFN